MKFLKYGFIVSQAIIFSYGVSFALDVCPGETHSVTWGSTGATTCNVRVTSSYLGCSLDNSNCAGGPVSVTAPDSGVCTASMTGSNGGAPVTASDELRVVNGQHCCNTGSQVGENLWNYSGNTWGGTANTCSVFTDAWCQDGTQHGGAKYDYITDGVRGYCGCTSPRTDIGGTTGCAFTTAWCNSIGWDVLTDAQRGFCACNSGRTYLPDNGTGRGGNCTAPTGNWTLSCPNTSCGNGYTGNYSCTGGNGFCAVNSPATGWCNQTACIVNGSCSTTLNTCTEGTFNDLTDTSTYYQWNCLGVNGGTNSGTCSSVKPCSIINGTNSIDPPTCTPVPTASVSVSPTTISYNTASTITWGSSGGATSCTASGAWSGAKAVGGGSVSTGNLTSSKTYSLICANAGGNSTLKSATVTVCGASTPNWNGTACVNITGSITPNTCAISAGNSSCEMNVVWTSNNTTAPEVRRPYAGNSVFASTATGNVPATFGYSSTPYTLELYNAADLLNAAILLGSANFTASCAAGTTWNGSVCLENVAIGSFTLTDANVYPNSSTNPR